MEQNTNTNNTANGDSREPEVELFGERVDSHDHSRRTKRYERRAGGGVVVGVFAIVAGIMLLLNNAGVVPWQFWGALVPLWPLLIVLFGAHIILGEGVVGRIVMLLLALITAFFGVLFGLRQVGWPIERLAPIEAVRIVDWSIIHMQRY